MKVLFSAPLNSNFYNARTSSKKDFYRFNAQSITDTVSFKGYEHLRLEGFDAAVASDFKLHLEKFKTKEDFEKWAKKELEKEFDLSKYVTVHKEYNDERMTILKEWKNYLSDDSSKINMNTCPVVSLMVFHGITKRLKADNKEIPPAFDPNVLTRTVNTLFERLQSNKNALFSFDKTYRNNLRLNVLNEADEETRNEIKTGWLKIDSLTNDGKNFEKNVTKLKMLSSRGWCTKSGSYAHDYLLNGDFHIYFENGRPKVGIRMVDNRIEAIQGALNNDYIPAGYFDEIEKYIKDQNFDSSFVDKAIARAKDAFVNINKIKKDISPYIEKDDTTAILKYFGISVKESKSGGVLSLLGLKKNYDDVKKTISHYSQPCESFSFSDIGIDENKLLKNVIKIEKDADFKKSEVTDLSALKEIGGNADFENSADIDVSDLRLIGGDAYFSGSKIKNLSSLERIGKSAYFTGAKDVDLRNLKFIGHDAWFDNTQNLNVSSLENIEGKLWSDYALRIKINKEFSEKKSA